MFRASYIILRTNKLAVTNHRAHKCNSLFVIQHTNTDFKFWARLETIAFLNVITLSAIFLRIMFSLSAEPAIFESAHIYVAKKLGIFACTVK